jgi:pimeloyl-ACP methyl ester carboxylesterase
MMDAGSRRLPFGGHGIAYRVAGHGPALVMVKPHRTPKDYPHVGVLDKRYRMIQIEPLGCGASERPREYSSYGLHEQVLAALDHERVDRFVVWGYSQGGAMAAVVAQASDRVVALVAGGYSLVDRPTDTHGARMGRDGRVPATHLAFWHGYKRYDWLQVLATMRCPRLVYVGGNDRAFAPGVRRTRELLMDRGVTVAEFEGLDHQTCNSEPAVSSRIVPRVVEWLNSTIGIAW